MIVVSGWDGLWRTHRQCPCQTSQEHLSLYALGGVENPLQSNRGCPSLFGAFISKACNWWKLEHLKAQSMWQNYFLLASHRVFFTAKIKSSKLWFEKSSVWRESKCFRTIGCGWNAGVPWSGERILFSEYYKNMRAKNIYSPVQIWVLEGKAGIACLFELPRDEKEINAPSINILQTSRENIP